MNYYYDLELHNQTKAACDCITNNPCNILLYDISVIKSKIDSAHVTEWKDIVRENFVENKEECSNKLLSIIQSIETTFINSEKLYKILDEQLEELRISEIKYHEKYNNKPKKQARIIYENNKIVGYDYSEYNKKLANWEADVLKLETICIQCLENVESYIKLLDTYNTEFIANNSISLSIPALVKSNKLVAFSFNNSNYLIIETEGATYLDISNTYGKQPKNACLEWSRNYSRDIYKYSNRDIGDPKAHKDLITSDYDETLKIMANELLNNRPCIIQVTGNLKNAKKQQYTRHFVTVVGIKENYDINNLQESDFLILDPTLPGDFKPLATKYEKASHTRTLLKCEKATYRAVNTNKGYAVLIYGDPSEYLSETCTQTEV